MRILTLDIETSPAVAHVWGIHKQHLTINQIITPTSMLCFAAKWYDRKPVIFRSTHHDGTEAMLDELWRLLDEADAVVHYNGTTFDVPHINREFLLAQMGPPSPFAQIDLYRTVRSRFRFLSAKLDSVAQSLELGQKASHEGLGLWQKCLDGDGSAWARMKRYNVQDVRLTEELYVELLPWIRSHPSVNLIDDLGHACPTCGSTDLRKRGTYSTKVSTFQRWECKDCRSYSRSGQRLVGVDLRGI